MKDIAISTNVHLRDDVEIRVAGSNGHTWVSIGFHPCCTIFGDAAQYRELAAAFTAAAEQLEARQILAAS